jgi:hypothetical protein
MVLWLTISALFGATPPVASADVSASCPLGRELTESEIESLTVTGEVTPSLKAKIQKPEDIICCLPETYRREYLIAPASKSAQIGSARAPRVILYTLNKDTLGFKRAISFLGATADPKTQSISPELDKTNNLEIMQFQRDSKDIYAANPSHRPFLFTDVAFKRGPDGEYVKTNGAAFHAEPGSKVCSSCHGGDPSVAQGEPGSVAAPLFDKDPIWTPFFGQFGFGDFSVSKSEMQAELNDLEAFQKTVQSGSDPRYACLTNLSRALQCAIEKDKLSLAELNSAPDSCARTSQLSSKISLRALKIDSCKETPDFSATNQFFSGALKEANSRRQALEIVRTPDYKKFRYAILGSLRCPLVPLDDFLAENRDALLPQARVLERKAVRRVRDYLSPRDAGTAPTNRTTDDVNACDRRAERAVLNSYLKAGNPLAADMFLENGRRGFGAGYQFTNPVPPFIRSGENLRYLFLGRDIDTFSTPFDANFLQILDPEALAKTIEETDGRLRNGLSAEEAAAYAAKDSADQCAALLSASRRALGAPWSPLDFPKLKARVHKIMDFDPRSPLPGTYAPGTEPAL